MSTSRLIDQLKLAPLVWGRCFSVVAAEFEYASDLLDGISPDTDASALREIERLYSARAHHRDVLLSGNPRHRPSGPFSSVLLEALSIRRQRSALDAEPMGGWLCHVREADAIFAAQNRFRAFCSNSGANCLSSRLQVYSARIAGRFATNENVLRLLAGARSANDPRTVSDNMAELRAAGIAGIVLDQGENPTSALVLNACAVTQLRQTRAIEVLWDGDQAIVRDSSIADQDGEPEMCPAILDLLG